MRGLFYIKDLKKGWNIRSRWNLQSVKMAEELEIILKGAPWGSLGYFFAEFLSLHEKKVLSYGKRSPG